MQKMLLELKTVPELGFRIMAPIDEGHALQFFLPITPAAAQGLVLALLANPAVAGALSAEFLTAFDEALAEHAEVQAGDVEFLHGVGVAS
jgi:hypothetical protein